MPGTVKQNKAGKARAGWEEAGYSGAEDQEGLPEGQTFEQRLCNALVQQTLEVSTLLSTRSTWCGDNSIQLVCTCASPQFKHLGAGETLSLFHG